MNCIANGINHKPGELIFRNPYDYFHSSGYSHLNLHFIFGLFKELPQLFPRQALVFTCLHFMFFENTTLSNFSFSHSVFYPVGELCAIFIKFEIVFGKLFLVWKSLKFVILERVNQGS